MRRKRVRLSDPPFVVGTMLRHDMGYVGPVVACYRREGGAWSVIIRPESRYSIAGRANRFKVVEDDDG